MSHQRFLSSEFLAVDYLLFAEKYFHVFFLSPTVSMFSLLLYMLIGIPFSLMHFTCYFKCVF